MVLPIAASVETKNMNFSLAILGAAVIFAVLVFGIAAIVDN